MRYFFGLISIYLAIFSGHALGADERASKLNCLTLPIDRAAVRATGIESFRVACFAEFREKIHVDGMALSDSFYDAALATVVAHYFAPYGPASGIDFETIMQSKTMSCGNYGALVAHLVGDYDFDFVGFEGGAVGNHQQLFTTIDGVNVLLDPTIGLIALANFDNVLSGVPVTHMFSFFSDEPRIAKFNAKVIGALSAGRYKPSDLLYFYPDFASRKNHSTVLYPTPGGVAWRNRKRPASDRGAMD